MPTTILVHKGEYTPGALTRKVRKILHSKELGAQISGKDLQFMTSVCERHPEPTKLKHAMRDDEDMLHLKVDAGWKSSRCFYFLKTDGSWEDIGVIKYCCNTTPKVPLPYEKFKAACRVASDPQTYRVREEAIRRGDCCPISGVVLTRGNCDVHHKDLTFDEIVAAFMREIQISLDSLEYVGSQAYNFKDRHLAQAFAEFHEARANLVAMSRAEHRKLNRKTK